MQNYTISNIFSKFSIATLDSINKFSIQGLSSLNFKTQVASDINIKHNPFLFQSNLKSQTYLDEIASRTKSNQIKLNAEKSKFMIVKI